MGKQNPIRAHAATKIRYFSDRLLGALSALLRRPRSTAIDPLRTLPIGAERAVNAINPT
jgi:hypothetical protein